MSWKTIVIKEYDKISLHNNNLLVSSLKDDKKEPVSIAIDDLNCVLLENNYTLFSIQIINKLIDNDVLVLIADDKHDPNVIMLPLASHCMPLINLDLQLHASDEIKQKLWTRVAKNKVINQISIMKELGMEEKAINQCEHLLETMQHNDKTNHEGIVAKVYFRCIYGSNFIRFTDDTINNALNYGYKIISSCLSRTIVKYGFNLYVGIHHIGRANPFNLTYDLIEPYRPIVDRWVYLNWEKLDFEGSLQYIHRLSLLDLLQKPVIINKKVMSLNSSFNVYVKSLISALKYNEDKKLETIKILESDFNNQDYEDD